MHSAILLLGIYQEEMKTLKKVHALPFSMHHYLQQPRHKITWVSVDGLKKKCSIHICIRDFPGGSDGKASVYNAGDLGSIPGSGRSPGEGNGTPLQYSCLKIPWTEEPGRPQSMGWQRVGHDWVTSLFFLFSFDFQSAFIVCHPVLQGSR